MRREQPPRGEPYRTIYLPDWSGARQRVGGLPPAERQLFGRLLNHVEQGWLHVRRLQLAYEHADLATMEEGALSFLLNFIDGDIVDLFRMLASDAAGLVPGGSEFPDDIDSGDMDGEASLFERYMYMLRLASAAPETPRDFRELVSEVVVGLEGWLPEFKHILRAIDEVVAQPAAA